ADVVALVTQGDLEGVRGAGPAAVDVGDAALIDIILGEGAADADGDAVEEERTVDGADFKTVEQRGGGGVHVLAFEVFIREDVGGASGGQGDVGHSQSGLVIHRADEDVDGGVGGGGEEFVIV